MAQDTVRFRTKQANGLLAAAFIGGGLFMGTMYALEGFWQQGLLYLLVMTAGFFLFRLLLWHFGPKYRFENGWLYGILGVKLRCDAVRRIIRIQRKLFFGLETHELFFIESRAYPLPVGFSPEDADGFERELRRRCPDAVFQDKRS